MSARKFYTMVTLASVMMSCAKEPVNRAQTELRLSSGVEVQARAAFTDMDTQIPAGETTVIYVDETGGTPLYEKNILTADGNGGLSGGVKMYFPESGKNADIYALHTNASWSGNAYPASALTHTVAVDQRARGDYAASDLLYGRTMNVAKTTQDVGLTFYHLLSKVQVAVVAGKGLTPADIRGITIGGTRIEALFALDKATAPGTVAVTAAGTARDIMAGADVSQEFTAPLYNDVVIVPQTVAGNTAFITVHLVTGDLVYRLPVNVTFTGGRRYIYQITANLAGLELKTSIANWTPINPVAGDAVIE